MRLREEDYVCIDAYSVLTLARQYLYNEEEVEEKDDLIRPRPLGWPKLMRMQRRCPFYFDIGQAGDGDASKIDKTYLLANIWKMEWEKSSVRDKILSVVQDSASKMRRVSKVVYFGDIISPSLEWSREYIQPLAAADVARTLAQAQNATVEIFVQNPQFMEGCEAVFADMSRDITVVDFASAEGLGLVDQNTFVVSLNNIEAATALIVELAIQPAGPAGPAGILTNGLLENAEVTWNGRSHRGPLPEKRYFWGITLQ